MKKIYFLFLIFGILACQIQVSVDTNEIPTIDSILKNIKAPSVPEYSISVTDFGAKGDSVTPNKAAVAKAIKDLNSKGGGTLIFPAGQYFMDGPIHMVSNMDLHIEKGARIFFSSDYNDYLPVVKTSWEGTFLYNYSPFIYAYNCKNIRITGEGIIDGEASETWAKWHGLQKKDQLLSREMNHNNTPIDQRIFGEGHYLRPQLIQLYDCKNILVEGVKIEDSPFWCLHLLRCENITVRNIKYEAYNKNNDGIDPEYSKNILIEDITFNNSDDNIAIKSGRDDEGRASEFHSENIIVRNCHFKGLHAIVIGSEMSAGVENVYVENCDFAGKLKRGIYLKSNPDRGGYIKNIFINDVKFGEVEDCIYITSYYHNEGEGHITDIKDIYFENISCQKAKSSGIVMQGFPDKKLSDIYFKNIKIDSTANPLSMENTENISFSDVIIGQLATSPSFVK
ncbi:glycoside hydrolase family 28 protein [Plebeiibacterium sediminum]|uniref:Glycoside hydrolase family 28 protein n=1 Tax=Plebeiibacterium sediminum TaxID=2992112 RepID=A0AAE3SGG4_9BACT|nr:glycoside hydrolase family 28 protein [Plebeiobacterium sediminum]MCW3788311.1 glycoside hydrolase family 28 protein [Plebeiobacterium sediminum]